MTLPLETRRFNRDRLRSARRDRGLSQIQLSQLIGVPNVYVGRWERGNNEPSFRYVVGLAEVLDLDLDDLVAE